MVEDDSALDESDSWKGFSWGEPTDERTELLDSINWAIAQWICSSRAAGQLQGDHGPGSELEWSGVEGTNMHERLSILNALRVPDDMREQLYPSITPVNVLRLVMAQLLDADVELLPDRSYYSSWPEPYEFHELDGEGWNHGE